MSSITYTSDKVLIKSPIYYKVVELLGKLQASEVLQRMAGNCITASDMIQTMLTQSGIECETVEVQTCINRTGEQMDFYFVGYDGTNYPGQIDTHMVVITRTDPSIIIDVSISHLLPEEHPYIVERVTNNSLDNIGDYEFDNVKVSYQRKKIIRVPSLHQKTMLERIKAEHETEKTIKMLKWLVVGALVFGGVNFIFNSVLILLRLVTMGVLF